MSATRSGSSSSAGSTPSCTPGERSMRCAPRPGSGVSSRSSSTASTTFTRSSATRSRRWRGWSDAEVTVSLTYEPGRAALSARAEVVEELRPLAQRVVELPALGEHYDPASRAALHQLERALFEPEPAPARVEPGEAIALLEAGGELAEAELVAAEVLELLRAGVPGEEIAVVYRSPERSAALIERVFRRYGIPVAIERRRAWATTALGRALLALAPLCAARARTRARGGRARVPARAWAARGAPRRSTSSRPRCAARACAPRLRHGRGARGPRSSSSSPRSTLSAPPRTPARSWPRQARRLLAAPHRGRAPVLGAAEELDARAVGARAGAGRARRRWRRGRPATS